MSTVVLYGKPGCHLCDEAREVLEGVRRDTPFELVETDITTDPGLERTYGERIPVITIDGEEAYEYFLGADALRERLGG